MLQHCLVTMDISFFFMLITGTVFSSSSSVEFQPSEHIIPEGTQSVNGSDGDGGCEVPVILTRRCGVPNSSTKSFLIDDIIPELNTTGLNWTSELVTVKKNTPITTIPFDHVLLAFEFEQSVSLTSITLSLFNCPQWDIGAPDITVYGDENGSTFFNFDTADPYIILLTQTSGAQSSCDSLLPVTITLQTNTKYQIWYILVSFETQQNVAWVHVGEVQFFSTPQQPPVAATISEPDIGTSSISRPQPPASIISKPGIMTSTTTSSTNKGFSSVPNPSSTPVQNPSSSSKSSSSAIVGIVVAIVVLVVLFILAVVILVLFVIQRRRKLQIFRVGSLKTAVTEYRAKDKNEYEFQNPEYESVSKTKSLQPNAAKNPLYSTSVENLAPYNNGPPVYEKVDEEATQTSKGKRNSIENAQYDYIDMQKVKEKKSPSPAPNHSPPEVPIYSIVEKPIPKIQPKSPLLYTDLEADKKPSSTSLPIYSDVTKQKAPEIPNKSPALEMYLTSSDVLKQSGSSQIDGSMSPPTHQIPPKLATLSGPIVGMATNPIYHSADQLPSFSSNYTNTNIYSEPAFANSPPSVSISSSEDIYSEPINPSDFMQESSPAEVAHNNVLIYAPVYTEPSTPQEGYQSPPQVIHDNILEGEVLGSGQFGQVVLASTKGLSLKDLKLSKSNDGCSVSILVAVKKLLPNAHKGQQEAFDKEVRFISQLNHGNIVRMLGVCSSEPAFIMMEYMEEGDLNQFLHRYSEIVSSGSVSSETQISTSTLIYMATQIASAMKYLVSLNFVHRDLATRNCLVGKNFVVKLADFGLSRNLYQASYYRIQGNAILPIRWMATESYYGKFSEKTDVWSFGVIMWELFTLANEQPYSEMTDKEVINDAIKGYKRQLLPKPNECPESVFQIMMQCWSAQPEQRPAFAELHNQLLSISF